jgi:hypothetical protein
MPVLRSLLISSIVTALLLYGASAFAYDAEFDYNQDGAVDEADITLILAAFNSTEGQPEFSPIFDHDGDGFIGGADLSMSYAAVAAE